MSNLGPALPSLLDPLAETVGIVVIVIAAAWFLAACFFWLRARLRRSSAND